MPSAEEIRDTLVHYVERLSAGDVDTLAGLYTEDGWVEDPVGGPRHEGREAVAGFYAGIAPLLTAEICGPICVAGSTGVMPLIARLEMPGQTARWLDAIDVVELDESGLIRSLRAYWNPAEMRDER